jgi:hypothetical protein
VDAIHEDRYNFQRWLCYVEKSSHDPRCCRHMRLALQLVVLLVRDMLGLLLEPRLSNKDLVPVAGLVSDRMVRHTYPLILAEG